MRKEVRTIELTGKILDMSLDFVSGKPKLSLEINEYQDAMACYDEYHKSDKVKIEISRFKEKRSNEANSYFWVLCGKLAAKTKQRKTDIYKQLIREIGDNFEILPLRNDAVETFVKNWGAGKLGWVCDILGDSKIEGYTNVCAYYGSSTYNKQQMSALIDSVIFECKEQGIQTETPEEIERLKSLWEVN